MRAVAAATVAAVAAHASEKDAKRNCFDVCLCLLAGKVFLLDVARPAPRSRIHRVPTHTNVMCLLKRVFSLLQIYTAQF